MPTRTPKRQRSTAPARTAIKTTPAKKAPTATPTRGRPAAPACGKCKTPMTPDNRSKPSGGRPGECLTCARNRARAGRIARGEVRNLTAAERRRVAKPAGKVARGKGPRRGK